MTNEFEHATELDVNTPLDIKTMGVLVALDKREITLAEAIRQMEKNTIVMDLATLREQAIQHIIEHHTKDKQAPKDDIDMIESMMTDALNAMGDGDLQQAVAIKLARELLELISEIKNNPLAMMLGALLDKEGLHEEE